MKYEKRFIAQFKHNRVTAYKEYLSDHYRLLRNGRYAVRPESTIDLEFQIMPPLEFEIEGYALADSGDMGVVYGYCHRHKEEHRDAYLRVWRREGKRWKMVLEVVR